MKKRSLEAGSALLVSLVMLLLLTLLAISAVKMTSMNLRMVGNMQSEVQGEAAVQLAIDEAISSTTAFNTPAPSTPTINGYGVKLSAAECLASESSPGWEEKYSPNQEAGGRYDNHWHIKGSIASGAVSGESATIDQGVRLKNMLAQCVNAAP
ncbi:PilX N-terminal domain-containing pilus assembly protein [Pseudomonas sp. GCM10022186]|uniref:PilX N-terminal domain-containing pilus assembly protein n=1 Tax=Pseudomonas sp. GCM10022186 TaxID=3252650 RepID=UPI0036079BBA